MKLRFWCKNNSKSAIWIYRLENFRTHPFTRTELSSWYRYSSSLSANVRQLLKSLNHAAVCRWRWGGARS